MDPLLIFIVSTFMALAVFSPNKKENCNPCPPPVNKQEIDLSNIENNNIVEIHRTDKEIIINIKK